MKYDMNKGIFSGNLVRDPEIKSVGGKNLTEFTIAVNVGEKAIFIPVKGWEKAGDVIINYCKKGSPVLIEGRWSQETWDSPDGKKNSKLVLTLEKTVLLGGGKKSEDSSESKSDPSIPEPQSVEDIF